MPDGWEFFLLLLVERAQHLTEAEKSCCISGFTHFSGKYINVGAQPTKNVLVGQKYLKQEVWVLESKRKNDMLKIKILISFRTIIKASKVRYVEINHNVSRAYNSYPQSKCHILFDSRAKTVHSHFRHQRIRSLS
jgi:hypothetical protein